MPGEAEVLTDIAIKAKGHWGYSDVQMAHWAKQFLTVSPEYVAANHAWVASVDSRPVAFAAIKLEAAETILDHLWVLPAYIGQGIGKSLFLHAALCMDAMHCHEFVFASDPHADGFYYKMGAAKIGDNHSGLQARALTKFRYCIRHSG